MLTVCSRIDDNVEAVTDNVEGAQRELLKYWSRVSGNRMLIAKMFGVLMICKLSPCLVLSCDARTLLMAEFQSSSYGFLLRDRAATLSASAMYNLASLIPLRSAYFPSSRQIGSSNRLVESWQEPQDYRRCIHIFYLRAAIVSLADVTTLCRVLSSS